MKKYNKLIKWTGAYGLWVFAMTFGTQIFCQIRETANLITPTFTLDNTFHASILIALVAVAAAMSLMHLLVSGNLLLLLRDTLKGREPKFYTHL